MNLWEAASLVTIGAAGFLLGQGIFSQEQALSENAITSEQSSLQTKTPGRDSSNLLSAFRTAFPKKQFTHQQHSAQVFQRDEERSAKEDAFIAEMRRKVDALRRSGQGPTLIQELGEAGGFKGDVPSREDRTFEQSVVFACWMEENPSEALQNFHFRGGAFFVAEPFLLFTEDGDWESVMQIEGATKEAAKSLTMALARRKGVDLAARLNDWAVWYGEASGESLKSSQGTIAYHLGTHLELENSQTVADQIADWPSRTVEDFSKQLTNRLALSENLAFLQRVAQNGQLAEYYSGVREKLSTSLQAATWLPVDERVEQCIEILQQDEGYKSGNHREKMRTETERNIAEAEVREQFTNSPEGADYISGSREAEEILQIWLQREEDWSSLPEDLLRERAFVLLGEENFERALPLIEDHLPPKQVARAISELARSAIPYRFETAIDIIEHAPNVPGSPNNTELNFARHAMKSMDVRISPLLLAENLQARPPSLTVEYLAGAWASWLQEEGGDAAVVSQLESLIRSPEVTQLYQTGKLNFP